MVVTADGPVSATAASMIPAAAAVLLRYYGVVAMVLLRGVVVVGPCVGACVGL